MLIELRWEVIINNVSQKKERKPKYRAELLKRLRVVWQKEFPLLVPAKPGVLGEYHKSDALFTISPERTQHDKFIHIWSYFVSKTPGEFTVEIIIHELEIPPNPFHSSMSGWPEDFPTGKNGRYRIGGLIGAPYGDRWWALKDNYGEHIEFMRKIGCEERDLLKRSDTKWIPSTYDQPFAGIVEEAIADLNRNLREKVFPVILKAAV